MIAEKASDIIRGRAVLPPATISEAAVMAAVWKHGRALAKASFSPDRPM
jgi:hypothetical protein